MTARFVSTVAGHADRGREFGTVHAERVAATVAAYERVFTAAGPIDLDELGAQALAAIDGFTPELGQEIRGIAAGAGLPVTRVAAINARTEILAVVKRRFGATAPGECSTVVALGDLADEPVAMQTWDWYADMADNWLEWTIPFPDGRRLTTVTEYGIVGKIGVNAYGVGVLVNILHHRDDGAGVGVPVHIVARWILEAAPDVRTALLTCAAARVSASTSLTVVGGRRAGKTAIAVELWPGGPGHVLPGERGVLVRTNHFLSEPGRLGDTEPREAPDSLIRYEVLRRRMATLVGRAEIVAGTLLTSDGVAPKEVLAAMTDHTGGVCCHPDLGAGPGPAYATLATVRLNVGVGSLEVFPGNPCGLPG